MAKFAMRMAGLKSAPAMLCFLDQVKPIKSLTLALKIWCTTSLQTTLLERPVIILIATNGRSLRVRRREKPLKVRAPITILAKNKLLLTRRVVIGGKDASRIVGGSWSG